MSRLLRVYFGLSTFQTSLILLRSSWMYLGHNAENIRGSELKYVRNEDNSTKDTRH